MEKGRCHSHFPVNCFFCPPPSLLPPAVLPLLPWCVVVTDLCAAAAGGCWWVGVVWLRLVIGGGTTPIACGGWFGSAGARLAITATSYYDSNSHSSPCTCNAMGLCVCVCHLGCKRKYVQTKPPPSHSLILCILVLFACSQAL